MIILVGVCQLFITTSLNTVYNRCKMVIPELGSVQMRNPITSVGMHFLTAAKFCSAAFSFLFNIVSWGQIFNQDQIKQVRLHFYSLDCSIFYTVHTGHISVGLLPEIQLFIDGIAWLFVFMNKTGDSPSASKPGQSELKFAL